MGAYIVIVLILFLIPGPAVLLTVSQTLKGGRKNGFLTGLGIALGDFIHTCTAVLGLSAILMTSATAFEMVKLAGAAYLFYIGVTSFLKKSKKDQEKVPSKPTSTLSLRQALFIELLNPKTALFFLAFLPQFVRHSGVPVTLQLLTLGLVFVVMSLLYTSLLVILSSLIGKRFFEKKWGNSRLIGKLVG